VKRSHVIAVLVFSSFSLAASDALAQGRSGKADSRGKGGQSVEQMQEAASETEAKQDKATKGKSSAAPDELSKEEREALREEEGPGILGRMRRFFGWERSQERMSEQGRGHQQATEQDRGPGDRQED
jgi:hypothetical protein